MKGEEAREKEYARQRQALVEKSEAMKSKAADEVGMIRNSASLMPRNFSAPDVFEKTGANGANYNSDDDCIMTEPALSRINDPFEP